MLSTTKMRPSSSTSMPVGRVKRYSGSKLVTMTALFEVGDVEFEVFDAAGGEFFGVAKQGGEVGAVGVIDFDLVLAPVADVNVTVGVDGNVAGAVELGGTDAGFADGLVRNWPSGVNFWMRSLFQSAT